MLKVKIKNANKQHFIAFFLLLVTTFTPFFQLQSQPQKPCVRNIHGTLPKGYYFVVPYKIKQAKGVTKLPIMVFNENNEILFYQYIDKVGDFKMHPNGVISYFTKSKIYLLGNHFTLFDSIACTNNAETDVHDFLILNNGHYVLLGYEFITEDYSKLKLFLNKNEPGSKSAKIKYGLIQEFDEQKKLIFDWSTKALFNAYDADPFFLYDTLNIDLTHLNSVDVDAKGDMIISARYLNEVFKIEKSSGRIVWRMGGKGNNITFLNDSIPFIGQHDARFTAANTFTLFDNGFNYDSLKHNARAIEYEVNDSAKTAKVIWSYANPKRIISEGNGNVQSLPNNLMLINYGKIEKGNANITFEIVDKTSNKQIAEVYFEDTLGTYKTLYYPTLPFKLLKEKIIVTKKEGINTLSLTNKHAHYIWNTGETTASISTHKKGEFVVYYSDDANRFFSSSIVIPKD
jgi:hypothetical protein